MNNYALLDVNKLYNKIRQELYGKPINSEKDFLNYAKFIILNEIDLICSIHKLEFNEELIIELIDFKDDNSYYNYGGKTLNIRVKETKENPNGNLIFKLY